MPKPSSHMMALHTIQTSRNTCLQALANFKEAEPPEHKDCERMLTVLGTYLDKIAEPVSLAFDRRMEQLMPKMNQAVAVYEQKEGKQISQKMLQQALLNDAADTQLNDLLHPFYTETIEPKRKLEKEIKSLRLIYKDIADLEQKLKN